MGPPLPPPLLLLCFDPSADGAQGTHMAYIESKHLLGKKKSYLTDFERG